MSVSIAEQDQIQALIDSSSREKRNELRKAANDALAEFKVLFGVRILNRAERDGLDVQAEILVRLDSTELGKGAFYRTRRRFQILRELNSG